MTELRIVSEPRGDAGDATFVRESLNLFNVAVTGDSYYSPLAIFLKDERGAVLGGALEDDVNMAVRCTGGTRTAPTGFGVNRGGRHLPGFDIISRRPNPRIRRCRRSSRSSSVSQDHPEVGEDSSSATTSPGPEKVGRPKVRSLSTSPSGAPLPSAAEARSSLLAG
jgi:hypothetical protein